MPQKRDAQRRDRNRGTKWTEPDSPTRAPESGEPTERGYQRGEASRSGEPQKRPQARRSGKAQRSD